MTTSGWPRREEKVRASKIVNCVDCGDEHQRKELNRKGRCRSCAMAAVRGAMYQLAAHEGPYYEKWKQGMKAAAEKL